MPWRQHEHGVVAEVAMAAFQALEAKHMQLLASFGEELEQVTDLFFYNKKSPTLPKNAAKHSGSVKWVRGLRERIEAPLDKIRSLSKAVLESDEARRSFKSHAVVMDAMQSYEQGHVASWISQVSKVRRLSVRTRARAPAEAATAQPLSQRHSCEHTIHTVPADLE